MGDEKVAIHDACYIFKHCINPKYISHYLRTSIYNLQIRRYVSEGKICSISAENIGKALIPVSYTHLDVYKRQGMYASNAGKSGGEYYTPQEVSELLTHLTLVGKTEVNKVYDLSLIHI